MEDTKNKETYVKIRWTDKNDVPIMEKPLLVLTENGKLMTLKHSMGCYGGDWSKPFSDWKNFVEKYKIKSWVYQEELIDKNN